MTYRVELEEHFVRVYVTGTVTPMTCSARGLNSHNMSGIGQRLT